MEHVSQSELNDYARGIKREPHPHLAECVECGDQLAFLRKVAESARRVEVPSRVVEKAKKIFPDAQKLEHHLGLKHVLARLVFLQTDAEPLLNLRGGQQTTRQAVYRYGDFCIDLRAEPELDSIKTSLVGQITIQGEPLKAVGAVSVALFAGPRALHQGSCNKLGEFVMDFVSAPRLRLIFDLPDEGIAIEVPIKELGSNN